MRELLNLHIGQCGIQIAQNFWQQISEEHGIDKTGNPTRPLQNEYANVFFNELDTHRYVPRSLIIDLDRGPIDRLTSGPLGGLFNPDNTISARAGTGNNWAKGFYTDGREILDSVTESLRRQVESCDQLQGFQFSHAIGGGTGSGLAARLLQSIKEEYPDRICSAFTIFPSSKVSDCVVEPYNTMLTIPSLVELTDLVMTIDNQSLVDLCLRKLSLPRPTYSDLNHLVTRGMTGVTCGMRFPGQLNSDLRKIAVNLIPFPRIHFLTLGVSPLVQEPTRVREMAVDMFKNIMLSHDSSRGRFMTASAMFRGNVSTMEVETQMVKLRNKHSATFVGWIPNSIMTSVCNEPSQKDRNSATLLGNFTCVSELMKQVSSLVGSMFRRKAFLFWYTNEGMDEMEFIEAESNLNDLISEYDMGAGNIGGLIVDDEE